VLLLTNGDSTIVRDTISDSTDYYSSYTLEEVNEHSGYFVLAHQGYEDRGSLVISRRGGWRKYLDFNLPVFDPEARYAVVTVPVDAAFWEPSIDIYRVTPDSLIREVHWRSPEEPDPFVRGDTLWGPETPRWQSGRLLFDTEETLVRNRLQQWPSQPMFVEKVNGRWMLRKGK